MTEQQQLPVTPPPELAREWAIDSLGQKPPWLHGEDLTPACMLVAAKASRWGWEQRGAVNEAELQKARDEQLEACCEWLRSHDILEPAIEALRAHCRPTPPSLADQALEALDRQERGRDRGCLRPEAMADADTIRTALERLKKLEEKAND